MMMRVGLLALLVGACAASVAPSVGPAAELTNLRLRGGTGQVSSVPSRPPLPFAIYSLSAVLSAPKIWGR